jgi:hypothetical protein
MFRILRLLMVPAWMLVAGHAAAQPAPPAPVKPMQLKNITPLKVVPMANPAAAPRLAPGVTLPVDEEAQVQAEMKRQQKMRDQISATLAKVGSNFSKLTYTPVGSNSCIDPDTTWNVRSGETYTCVGQTTCTARMARWSKSRTNPCEAGVTIDSCVITDECKTGSVCDVGKRTCIRQ